MNAADMSVEEFKRHLADMRDRLFYYKNYSKETDSKRDDPKSKRTYLTQKRGQGLASGSLKRRKPMRHQRPY